MHVRTVLVVDDNPDVRGLLGRYLTVKGYVVDCAGNAGDALRLVGERTYDAMILDLDLPDATGTVLHGMIFRRGLPQNTRTVFISGAPSRYDRAYITARGLPLLLKPFRPALLLEAISGENR